MFEYIRVSTQEEYEAAASLIKEYADWLNIDLAFQKFSEELLQLKKMYGPPFGGIILVKSESNYIGSIAIRKIDAATAELKRMYVKSDYQQHGIGSKLLEEALEMAKNYGYRKIQLDTLSNMLPAISLYRKNGFYEIPAYYFNPEKTAVYFEKIL
ncbi:GNAT family N-acetyltransferase [soil metagenome]